MAKYAAVCNRFPELQIGTQIKFENGSFETDDEELWALLKKNDWWLVHIHPRDGEPPAAETPAEPAPEPPAPTEAASDEKPEESPHGYGRVHRGSRGSR